MRRALVTGASGALGEAIAMRLAGDGWFVYCHGNSRPERLDALIERIEARAGPQTAAALCFDVTDADASAAALEPLLEQAPIDAVVSNAGMHDDGPMAGMSASQWRGPIDVSLHGFFHVTQPLLLAMVRQRHGRVIAISSVSGVIGNGGQTNYAAAKAGLHGAAKSLSREMASRGITVNVVAPGVIDSELTTERFDSATVRSLVPMQRMGRPEEVASVVSFLASDEAAYVSGQIIGVDGGMS